MIRVLLADDNPWVRESLAALLTTTGDMEVVAQCVDGTDVVAEVQRTLPDVVLLDLAMPVVDGLEATRRLLAVRPDARVVLLTGSLSPTAVFEAHRIGAAGYLLKAGDPQYLVEALQNVAAGGDAWSGATVAAAEAPLSAESPASGTRGDDGSA